VDRGRGSAVERPSAPATGTGGPALVLAPVVLGVVAGLAWLTARGLDRTDEGYYLNAAAHPLSDSAHALSFGLALHPSFVAAGGDVVAFRRLGIVLLVASVALLAHVVLRTPELTGTPGRWGGVQALVTSTALGLVSVLTLAQFPSTPGYNTLALGSLALAAAGVVLAVTWVGWAHVVGWLLVGAAGWLSFLAKPTSAAALAALTLLVVLLVPGRWRRGLPFAVAGLLLTAGGMLLGYRETPRDFLTVVVRGVEVTRELGGHSDLVRLDPLVLEARAALLVVVAALGSVAVLHPTRRVGMAWRLVGAVALTAGLVAAANALWSDGAVGVTGWTLTAAVLVVALAGVGLAARGLAARPEAGPPPRTVRWRQPGPALTVLLCLLPAAFAIGTNNNLWITMGRALAIWLIVLTARLTPRGALPAGAPALAGLLVTAVLLVATAFSPYRYPSLLRATSPAVVGPGGTVLLTPEDARETAALNDLAGSLGLAAGGVLDLTGDSPGYVFQTGARPTAGTWLIGGYAGSEGVTQQLLTWSRGPGRSSSSTPTVPAASPAPCSGRSASTSSGTSTRRGPSSARARPSGGQLRSRPPRRRSTRRTAPWPRVGE
jgi:hypothetical protein